MNLLIFSKMLKSLGNLMQQSYRGVENLYGKIDFLIILNE